MKVERPLSKRELQAAREEVVSGNTEEVEDGGDGGDGGGMAEEIVVVPTPLLPAQQSQ